MGIMSLIGRGGRGPQGPRGLKYVYKGKILGRWFVAVRKDRED